MDMLLDDLKYIHSKDSQDALGHALKQIEQLRRQQQIPAFKRPIDSVVFAGMGGSALPALYVQTWPRCTVPFEIWRRYDIPPYVSDRTLCIISSHSGNTEESISAFQAAATAKAEIVVIAGGGILADLATKQNYPCITPPEPSHPRFGTFANFAIIVRLLEHLGLTKASKTSVALQQAADRLQTASKSWQPDVPTKDNPAKQLAVELAGTSPVLYAGALMAPVAYKWKLGFNENAKNLAWWNEIPEFCHNEYTGWTSHPIEKAYSVVDLLSSFEHARVQKRFELTQKLLSGKRPHPYAVTGKGKNELEHMLYLSVFGDFVSLYVAILNNVDPTPLPYVNKLKSALERPI